MTFISMSVSSALSHVASAFVIGLAIGVGVTALAMSNKEKNPQLRELQQQSIKKEEKLFLAV